MRRRLRGLLRDMGRDGVREDGSSTNFDTVQWPADRHSSTPARISMNYFSFLPFFHQTHHAFHLRVSTFRSFLHHTCPPAQPAPTLD